MISNYIRVVQTENPVECPTINLTADTNHLNLKTVKMVERHWISSIYTFLFCYSDQHKSTIFFQI